MEDFIPKIVSHLKNYSIKQTKKDILSGIMVAIIALPLSIAFTLGCGLPPEKGIYSAIISSIIIGLLGGSRVQIAGPTGAFIVLIQSILLQFGMNGLVLTTFLAGIFLILMGVLHFGKFIKFIPTPIVTGFTGGIAITIFTLEVKDFLGFPITTLPTNFFDKWKTYFLNIHTINTNAILIGTLSLLIVLLWPKLNRSFPASFMAIFICTIISELLQLDINRLGEMAVALEFASMPSLTPSAIMPLIQPALSVALLIALQALFSAVMTDDMINSQHNPNKELVAQGISSLVLGIFALVPSTGGVARSIANVKNGGRTPIAAITHSLTLLLFILFGMPLLRLIPLSALAAILMVTAYNMFNIHEFLSYKYAPRSDTIILITSCLITFSFNLILAIEIGLVITFISFVKRMSEESHIYQWNDKQHKSNHHTSPMKQQATVPKHTLVYEVNGPLFFATANNIHVILHTANSDIKYVIIRMKGVTAIDVTAIKSLKKLHYKLHSRGIKLIFSHLLEQPRMAMTKAGLIDEIGEENICDNIKVALEYVANL